MINLAGRKDCDKYIHQELTEAGIEIVEVPLGRSEVPYTLIGKLGKYTFSRARYYWLVNGPVPLFAAQEMYRHPVGRRDVRVEGHCGCPPPEEWASRGGVQSYHIDSQSGLNLFCRTMRKYGLDSGKDPFEALREYTAELETIVYPPFDTAVQAQDIEYLKWGRCCVLLPCPGRDQGR